MPMRFPGMDPYLDAPIKRGRMNGFAGRKTDASRSGPDGRRSQPPAGG